METILKHGVKLNTVSMDEMRELLKQFQTRQETRERVRATMSGVLDATGFLEEDVYTVPPGWYLEVRRIFLDLGTVAADGSNLVTSSVSLQAATAVQYLRSGTRIEWGNPSSPASTGARVPGIQTWGSEQGPYLKNGEVFSVRALLGAAQAGVMFSATMEGILTKSGSLK